VCEGETNSTKLDGAKGRETFNANYPWLSLLLATLDYLNSSGSTVFRRQDSLPSLESLQGGNVLPMIARFIAVCGTEYRGVIDIVGIFKEVHSAMNKAIIIAALLLLMLLYHFCGKGSSHYYCTLARFVSRSQ
jgi:hypothetical protein